MKQAVTALPDLSEREALDMLINAAKTVLFWYDASPGTGMAEENLRFAVAVAVKARGE